MLVKIGLVFEFATTLRYRAVFCELRHVVDQGIQQTS